MDGSGKLTRAPPQFEQKRPLSGLLVPQRAHTRSGARCENSKGGAAGRIGTSLVRGGALPGAEGANGEGGAKNGGATEPTAGGGANA